MSSLDRVTFFHAPNSRSTGTLALLEELEAPYDLKVVSLKKGEQLRPEFLAINPMGKVPAIMHRGALVTEQIAIFTYLADCFRKRDLAPDLADIDRGPYLRWMAFYAGCFEPALVDKAMKREPASRGMSPYGDFESMLSTIVDAVGRGPYLLGDRFTAADVLWATGLRWATMFKIVPESDTVLGYIARVTQRPAMARAAALNAELAAADEAQG